MGSDSLGGDFAVGCRCSQELDAGHLFGSTAFVDVEMSGVRADHRVAKARECGEGCNIGSGAVEGQENLNLRPQHLAKTRDGFIRVGIVPIGMRVPHVDSVQSLHDLGVNSGVIVAAKAANALAHCRQCLSLLCVSLSGRRATGPSNADSVISARPE